MKEDLKNCLKRPGLLLGLFLVYTFLIKIVDVQPTGIEDTKIGFASLNMIVFQAFGQHNGWYVLTQLIGALAIGICLVFAMIGFLQLCKRRSFIKVDKNILLLGGFYLIVIGFYVLFQFVAVNYRPIMFAEVGPEASYPSSHTMLSICVFAAAMRLTHFANPKFFKHQNIVRYVLGALIVLCVVGRLLSGYHWFTDIMGGILLSAALLDGFNSLVDYINGK